MNPSCGKQWTNEFLNDVMTKVFMNTEYKMHHKKLLFDQETSFLPATQMVIENDKQVAEMNEKIKEAAALLNQLKIEKTILMRRNDEKIERREFVRACPATECRGFLSTQWKCGLCNVKVCKDCHEIVNSDTENDHICDPDILKTAKLLESDSKNCPKCAAIIFKIDGCSQMFCTKCHTAFDWKTMRIDEGRIHNPHYYEWLRTQANGGEIRREPGDNQPDCENRLPTFYELTKLQKNNIEFWKVYRTLQHVRAVCMTQHPAMQPVTLDTNMDLRKRYLKNEITKEAMHNILEQRDKKRQKDNDINQILSMFVDVTTDRIRDIYINKKYDDIFINLFIERSKALVSYVNTSLLTVKKRYGYSSIYNLQIE